MLVQLYFRKLIMIKEENLNYNWKFIQIKDACELVMGQSPPGSSYNEKRKGMPFLQGKAEFGKTYPHNVKYTTDPKRTTKKGNILMSVRAPVGDVNIANIDYCIGRGLASLNLKNGDNKYLFYLLNYIKPKIEQSGTGSTFKAITKSGLEKIKIPVPTLETQKKIVEIMEKAEKLKEWRAGADELIEDYLKSLFAHMFFDKKKNKDWEVKSLSEICEVNPRKSEINDLPSSTEITFLGMEDVGEKGEIFNHKIKNLGDVIKGYTYFKKNDVLFAKITPCMENGKGTIARIDTEIGFGSTEFHVLRPKEVNSEWIYHLLSLDSIRDNAENMMTGSAGQKRVSKRFFDKLTVSIPPLELQNQFARIVQQMETLKVCQSQSKQQIDNLFNTLMQKAFKGELVC